jgi:hypothetical protein
VLFALSSWCSWSYCIRHTRLGCCSWRPPALCATILIHLRVRARTIVFCASHDTTRSSTPSSRVVYLYATVISGARIGLKQTWYLLGSNVNLPMFVSTMSRNDLSETQPDPGLPLNQNPSRSAFLERCCPCSALHAGSLMPTSNVSSSAHGSRVFSYLRGEWTGLVSTVWIILLLSLSIVGHLNTTT